MANLRDTKKQVPTSTDNKVPTAADNINWMKWRREQYNRWTQDGATGPEPDTSYEAYRRYMQQQQGNNR